MFIGGIKAFITEDIKELSHRVRKHFLKEVAWWDQPWAFPADRDWYVVHLNGITDTGEVIEGEYGYVLCTAADHIRGVAPRQEEIKDMQTMLDLLDSNFPCWKDVRKD